MMKHVAMGLLFAFTVGGFTWMTATPQPRLTMLIDHERQTDLLQLSSDGKYLTTNTSLPDQKRKPVPLVAWDLGAGGSSYLFKEAADCPTTAVTFGNDSTLRAFKRDGEQNGDPEEPIYSGTVYVWDLPSRQLKSSYRVARMREEFETIWIDNEYHFVDVHIGIKKNGESRTIVVRDFTANRVVTSPQLSDGSVVYRERDFLVSLSNDSMKIWRLPDFVLLTDIRNAALKNLVVGFRIGSDGRTIVEDLEDGIRIWDTFNDTKRILPHHGHPIVLCEDNRWLLSAETDVPPLPWYRGILDMVMFWAEPGGFDLDLAAVKIRYQLRDLTNDRTYPSITNDAATCLLSANGKVLVTVDDAGLMRVYDLPPRAPVGWVSMWAAGAGVVGLGMSRWLRRMHVETPV